MALVEAFTLNTMNAPYVSIYMTSHSLARTQVFLPPPPLHNIYSGTDLRSTRIPCLTSQLQLKILLSHHVFQTHCTLNLAIVRPLVRQLPSVTPLPKAINPCQPCPACSLVSVCRQATTPSPTPHQDWEAVRYQSMRASTI